MELYNSTIRELTEKLGGLRPQVWGYEPSRAWKDLGQNELVLTRDAAYELGEDSLSITKAQDGRSIGREDLRQALEHAQGSPARGELSFTVLPAQTLTIQEIYRQVNPSVVTVVAQLGEQEASVGTGVIFSEDGYILTNYHVLEGGNACTVYFYNDHAYEAWYVAGDAESDLAVLKVEQTGLPAAQFGDSEYLTVGDTVYAIGNPLGYELRGTLTDGIVSAINRDVWVDGRTMNLIQTNAALNSGNSGGPLINVYGQVVGINTVKMSSSYSNVEGLGFAIPSATIRRLVNDLLTCGEILPEPVLGITVLSLGTRLGEDLWGVEVQSVTPDSAADLAGVEEGDYVVSAGGIDISSSADLLRARRQYHVGDEMPLTIWRDGTLMEVTLVLNEAASSENQ